MDKLYRISNETKDEFLTLINPLLKADEDGNYLTKKVRTCQLLTGESITINEIGHTKIPLEYNEDGEPLTEQLYHTDWAVDVATPVYIDELLPYLVIEAPEQWSNCFTGAYEIIK